jgi:diguanylate cyclase (GGDEF)-like protein
LNKSKKPSLNLLEHAEVNGVAVVVSDAKGSEISTNNNNSMCSELYYSDEFAEECAKYCGKALRSSFEAGRTIEYRCYAGLDCRAVPLKSGKKELVAIVGRAFTRSETYRQATERAITGDWRNFSPQEFFGNVLLAGSESRLMKAAAKLESLETDEIKGLFEAIDDRKGTPVSESVEHVAREREPAPETELAALVKTSEVATDQRKDLSAWRSLFGSLLKLDFDTARSSVLEFAAARYSLASVIWLEEMGGVFRGRLATGELSGRAISLEIDASDPQLAQAANGNEPLVISEERRAGNDRQSFILSLFPLQVGGDVKSILGIEGSVPKETADEISRFCRSVSSQMEILRLRNEVKRREAVSNAVSKFNDALKRLDDSDFWQHLTRVSAELLQAERVSLLARREGTAELEIVGSIGLRKDLTPTREIGSRVALNALDRRSPILVANATELALGPLESGVNYATQSFIAYPITLAEKGLAVLNLTERADGRSFDEADLEILHAIAPQMAVAIDRVAFKEQAGTYAQLSVTDSLTGLSNRRYLETRMNEEILRSSRHEFPMSFMMLDVDEFKSYNDRFGHPAGDEALKLVGLILKDMVRGEDVPARYGGEEFAVLFPQTSIKEAEAIAERIRERVQETEFPYRRVTVSIGLSTYSGELSSMSQLVSAADQALYDAKRSGRNTVCSFGRFEGPSDNVH